VDTYIKGQVETVVNGYTIAQLDALLSGVVSDTVGGSSQTPYTYQINKAGAPRPVVTGSTDESIMNGASEVCYTWDEGAAYPATNKPLTFGGTKPSAVEVSPTNPFTSVKAFQNVYRFIAVEDIVSRVSMSIRPGGAKVITKADGEQILYKMKEEFENTFSKGWDDDSHGDVSFSAFSDDNGAIGTFGRTLADFTTKSAALTLFSYLILVILCAALLCNTSNPVRSQSLLGFLGGVLVILAFFGAIGCTVLSGIKLNLIQTWTLPFLMVGIGVDDTFILTLAAREAVQKRLTRRKGGSRVVVAADVDDYEDSFVEAFVEVTTPVTLTSLVNAAMFVVMLFSDIPAVSLTAQVWD
jgi:hypothetical protein